MKKRTLSSLLFRTTKFIYSNVSSTQRPRYHGIVNEISEIIGFEIVAQLCLENSIQTLPIRMNKNSLLIKLTSYPRLS